MTPEIMQALQLYQEAFPEGILPTDDEIDSAIAHLPTQSADEQVEHMTTNVDELRASLEQAKACVSILVSLMPVFLRTTSVAKQSIPAFIDADFLADRYRMSRLRTALHITIQEQKAHLAIYRSLRTTVGLLEHLERWALRILASMDSSLYEKLRLECQQIKHELGTLRHRLLMDSRREIMA